MKGCKRLGRNECWLLSIVEQQHTHGMRHTLLCTPSLNTHYNNHTHSYYSDPHSIIYMHTLACQHWYHTCGTLASMPLISRRSSSICEGGVYIISFIQVHMQT